MMDDMECPYLEQREAGSLCGASGKAKVPSIEEMDELCTKEDHCRCIMLLGYVLREGGRMPLFERF